MPADVQELKAVLRAATLAARRQQTDGERAAAGAAIAASGIARWGTATAVAAYLSTGDEPPTRGLIDGLVTRGVQVLLPVIDGERLDWAAYSGPADLAAGPIGMTEPTGDRLGRHILAAVEAVIVPALAADSTGRRLGRGRGYYDRALTDVKTPLVAVVYDQELIDHVPTEAHDRSVNAVFTPTGYHAIG